MYCKQLKDRIINYYLKTQCSMNTIINIFQVSKTTVYRWLQNINTPTKQNTISKKSKFSIHSKLLIDIINSNCLLTLKEIKTKLNINIHQTTVWRWLKKLNYTMKKVRRITLTDKNTPEIKQQFKKNIKQLNPKDMLFLDEVGFQIEMYKSKGWSLKGLRCIYKGKIKGHKNITGVFTISTTNIVNYKLYKRGVNSDIFVSYLKDSNIKNKTLVMDNYRVHHTKDVKNVLKNNNISVLYTPPYSPELNPIEEMFSWFKRRLRLKTIVTEKQLHYEIEQLTKEINSNENNHLLKYYQHAYN